MYVGCLIELADKGVNFYVHFKSLICGLQQCQILGLKPYRLQIRGKTGIPTT